MADDLERADPLPPQRGPERSASLVEDFFTGCGTLVALGLVLFVVVPFFLFVVKASLAIG